MAASMDIAPRSTGRARIAAAMCLAIPLLGSAANFVFAFAEPPAGDEYLGAEMWRIMRDGGLFLWIVVGHAITGTMLLVPRWRFLGALIQLPITLGIAAFNVTLFPPGIVPALVMLLLNVVAVSDVERLRPLVAVRGA